MIASFSSRGFSSLVFLTVLTVQVVAQSIAVLPAFDPRLPGSDADGEPLGMNTHVVGVSADGRTLVGHAEEFVSILGTTPYGDDILELETVTFMWRDGVMTKLPFVYEEGMAPDPKLLGVSADGTQVYGVLDEDALYDANPPVSVRSATGGMSSGTFGPWVDVAPGLQRRLSPVGRWIGRSTVVNERVHAVSADGETLVGQRYVGTSYLSRAVVWTAAGSTLIAPTDGFTQSEATGVSADGRVVCGIFHGHDDDDIGRAGFVWTQEAGVTLIRDMVRDHGFPFDDYFPNIDPVAISDDGSTVVGDTDGVDASARTFVFRQLLGPTLSIRVPTDQGFSVGESFEAEVVVSSPTTQPQTFTFAEGGLMGSVDDTCELEFEDVEPFTLTQDDPLRSFKVKVTPKDYGTHVLTTAVTAVSSKGTVNLTAEAVFHISPLKVTVQMKPLYDGAPIINMKLNEAGKVTDPDGKVIVPKVEVTIENLGEKPIVAALQGVDPRARDRSAALGRLKTLGTFPEDFPSITKGAPIKREIALEINEDGRFEFRALVTARVQGGTHGFTAVGRGAPIAVGDPYPAQLELKLVDSAAITMRNNGAIFVKPGSTVQMLATVENLTTNGTIEFHGIEAEKRLNVMGARLTSDEGNMVDPPFTHDFQVDSGASEVLSGYIKTDAHSAGSGIVTWQGLEDLVLVDDETGERTELDMDDVLVKGDDTGWLNDPLALRVIQDRRSPLPPQDRDYWEIGTMYGDGAILAFGQWSYDTVDAIGGLGRMAGTVVGNPSMLADAWGEGSRAVWEMGEYAARTWKGMTPEQKEEFIRDCAMEVSRRAVMMAEGRVPFDQTDVNAALNYTQQATYGFFTNIEDAYASDDPARIAQALGQFHGRVGLEVIGGAMPAPKFQQYSKAAEGLALAENLNDARLITEQSTLLRTLKPGLVDAEILRKGWGVGGRALETIQSVFARFKVKGYMRERSPRSIALIDEMKEAVWKPEAMKPKGFSEIDELILDDLSVLPKVRGSNGQELGLDGVTVIFLPEADDIIAHRARTRLIARGNYPLEDIEEAVRACLERAKQRRKEFAEYAPKFHEWDRDTRMNNGGIPVRRNYRDNGVPDPEGFDEAKRRFSFEKHVREGKETIYIPKMADSSGVQRFISGDIDWIHFTFLDGTPLDAKTAAALYDAMFRSCGLQHPETISWILDKQTVFKGKFNQIGEYMTNQKVLLEVTGSSTRAVHMSTEFSRFATNGRDHLIFFSGGIKARSRALLADAESALAHYKKLFPDRRVILPFLPNSRFREAMEASGGSGDDWRYSTNGDESVILREGLTGVVERYDGVKWAPWTPPPRSAPRASGYASAAAPLAQINLTPTSNLSLDASKGAQTLEIANLPADWEAELAGRVSQWFSAGQRIVIAPGELTQEVRELASVSGGTLTLSTPLAHAHPANTLVAVVPSGMTFGEISDTASELLTTVVDTLRERVTLVWTSLPGYDYSLEYATTAQPGTWRPLLTGLTATEVTLTLEIPLSEYDATRIFRLKKGAATRPAEQFRMISFNLDRASNTATLIWSSTAGREYVAETSPDLAEGSWKMVLPTIIATGQTATLTLPVDLQKPRMFYRIRDLTTAPLASGLKIESFLLDPVAGHVELSWISEPGKTYTVEYSDDLTANSWRIVPPATLATGPVSKRTIPYNPNVPRRFYRVKSGS